MGDQDIDWSLQNGDVAQVKSYFEQNPAMINKQFDNGRTALCMAADYGQKDVIDYLISKGADVNIPDKFTITPLLAAIFEGHTSCVEVLLKNGAKKDGKAPSGDSYIDSAEKSEIKELLK